ncbi:chymotrypsin-2 [Scaptodrosophila lebanonensis]|uniref:Chymotrypsin-2 n=1 Tax=Drosophila lebanonensis TaxID=7225 RepID=A0A6J2TGV8_DROLE|nr:chymotrypsin-2 [Scaptodrosophila lebanonensis]
MSKLQVVLFLGAFLVATVSCAPSIPIGRVVNGTDSDVHRYPFVISLRGATGSHSCGGSIVSPKFVLTAAHCVNGRKAADLSIQYGVTQINAKGPNVVAAKRIIQHELYNPAANYVNDIALIEVAEPIVFDYETVAPVTLPPLNFETPQTPEGGEGVLIGWGLNATSGSIQTTLQEVNLKVYSDDECVERHSGRTNPSSHICGGVDEGGKGQCSGDSGGPLIYDGQQVGIVSWSIKPCTVAPYPGVYCKVSAYTDWIINNQITLA